MQKLFRISAMTVLITTVLPIMCMNNSRMVYFKGDFNIISVPESHLQLMGAWKAHYQKYKKLVDNAGIIPLFEHVSGHALELVSKALDVGAYKFNGHYNALSEDDRDLLLNVSDLCSPDGKKRLMLDIPQLTEQLIDVRFPQELVQHIKNIRRRLGDDDEGDVRNYFREKLIRNKGLLGGAVLKQPFFNTNIIDEIYPSSLFLDAYHTNHSGSPIPLAIAGQVCQTYATQFITDTREHRITDIKGNCCNLWVIDHKNIHDPNYTYSRVIEHKGGDIKGCVLSKTGTGVEYAVTYSDHDIQIATITTHNNNVSYVEICSRSAKEGNAIVDVCFGHAHNTLLIALYEGMNSCIMSYSMQSGHCGKGILLISFKKYGLLEKIFIGNCEEVKFLMLLCGAAGFYTEHFYKRSDLGNYQFSSVTELMNMDDYNAKYPASKLRKRGDSVFMYDRLESLFKKTVEAAKAAQEKSLPSWLVDKVNGSVERLDSEYYRIYSPDGKFLLCNSLIKKAGAFAIETVLKDAVTHKPIMTIDDTAYDNFLGVGFTHDGTELIFLNYSPLQYKISLLNPDDNKMLQKMEELAFGSIGITALLKRLCMECKKNGTVALYKNDPAHTMLKEWSRKSPMALKLLKECLPFYLEGDVVHAQ
jgi:hypothetical protein